MWRKNRAEHTDNSRRTPAFTKAAVTPGHTCPPGHSSCPARFRPCLTVQWLTSPDLTDFPAHFPLVLLSAPVYPEGHCHPLKMAASLSSPYTSGRGGHPPSPLNAFLETAHTLSSTLSQSLLSDMTSLCCQHTQERYVHPDLAPIGHQPHFPATMHEDGITSDELKPRSRGMDHVRQGRAEESYFHRPRLRL